MHFLRKRWQPQYEFQDRGPYLLKLRSSESDILPHVRQFQSNVLVTSANPQIITAYPRPMVQGAEVGETKGLAGSRTDQMMRPYRGLLVGFGGPSAKLLTMNEQTKNSMKNR
jgi:hypothetical protein